jgi:hypothetical protein
MKQILCVFFAIFFAGSLVAQDCKNFYYLTKDAEIQMNVYDAKGNENGKQTWKVDEVKQEGVSWRANVKTEFVDKKGRDGSKANGVFRCEGGVLKADMRMSIPQQPMEAYKNMEVKADEMYKEYPSGLSAGQALTDANYKMEVYNKGQLQTTITYKETNRKVEGKESVTTPAGTWDAYKIMAESNFKASFGNTGAGLPFNLRMVEWYVPGFGVVKTETYNKNGKLLGSTQIVSVKK